MNLHECTTIETISAFVVALSRYIPIDRPPELPWNLSLANSPVELLFSNEQLTMLTLWQLKMLTAPSLLPLKKYYSTTILSILSQHGLKFIPYIHTDYPIKMYIAVSVKIKNF